MRYLGNNENLFVHLLAIDAATLLNDDHQAFAFSIRLGQILTKVFEGVAHPGRFVQPVVAQFSRLKLKGKKKSSQNGQ